MKNAIAMSVLSVTALAWTGSALAGNQNRIDNRHNTQAKRLDRGTSSGDARAAQRATAQQSHVNKVESRAASDGKTSAAERAHLERAKDKQNKYHQR